MWCSWSASSSPAAPPGTLPASSASFAPRRRPLYIGAPDAVQLALAAADIRRAIVNPAPLRRSTHDLWSLDALVDARPDAALPACRRAS